MTAHWQPLSLLAIPGVASAVSAAKTGATAGAVVAETAADGLAVLGSLAALLPTPSNLAAPIALLSDALADLFGAGVYAYVDAGYFVTGSGPDGLAGFVNRWSASLDDAGDGDRPTFSSLSTVDAWLLVTGAAQWPQFAALATLLADLLKMPQLAAVDTSIPRTWQDVQERGMATPPNWARLAARDVFPVYGQVVDAVEEMVSRLETPASWAAQVAQLRSVAEAKAAGLRALADQLDAIAATIAALSQSQLSVLHVTGAGIEQVRLAVQYADASSQGLTADAYVVGVCLAAGGPDVTPLRTVMSLLTGVAA